MMREALHSILNTKRNNIYTRRFDRINFDGNNFLVAPIGLLKAFHSEGRIATLTECADYWYLSSMRNYAEYSITGDKSLGLHRTRIPIEKLSKNGLLHIENNRIYFKLEE